LHKARRSDGLYFVSYGAFFIWHFDLKTGDLHGADEQTDEQRDRETDR